jgi:hypothetical protein
VPEGAGYALALDAGEETGELLAPPPRAQPPA